MPPDPPPRPPRLRLRVSPAAERAVRAGHPWVFADSVQALNRPGESGELAVIFDRHDRFLAVGLYDPDSPLRLRVLHFGRPVQLDAAWWQARLQTALDRRRGLFDSGTTGYRCIHGENDGWPGLVVDRYGGTLVLKLYTAAWFPRVQEVAARLQEALGTAPVVLRLSRNIQSPAAEARGWFDGRIVRGHLEGERSLFLEDGLRFEADVVRGQKTGFFLDQRDNRRAVRSLAAGTDVLNLFSFSGGFSLQAAAGGARSATDIDLSEHALAGARRHFALNPDRPAVAACRHETVQADIFEWLQTAPNRRFGVVVVDPPSLAKRESERAGALRAYARLVEGALGRLQPGGLLVAASCSAHVPQAEFFDVVRRAAAGRRSQVTELQTTGHPPDHPATFPEAHYLKAIYLRVGGAKTGAG